MGELAAKFLVICSTPLQLQDVKLPTWRKAFTVGPFGMILGDTSFPCCP
jgi:hypothetical protein